MASGVGRAGFADVPEDRPAIEWADRRQRTAIRRPLPLCDGSTQSTDPANRVPSVAQHLGSIIRHLGS